MAQNATQSVNHVLMRLYAEFSTPSYTSTFSFVGTFPSDIFSEFHAAASTLLSSCSHYVRLHFITPFNQSITFIIPVLIAFQQLKYQGGNNQNNTPFASHPTTMLIAVSSSVVYSLAYFAILRFPPRRFAAVAQYCLMWSGCASVAFLASPLFPDSISPSVYAIFVLISAGGLLYSLYHKLVASPCFLAYGRRVRRFFNYACRIVPNSSGQRPQILPI